jgi:hypothetical protein
MMGPVPLALKAAASEAEAAAHQQQDEDDDEKDREHGVTSQRLIDLARSWLPALVASIVSLYSLGDLVYGFL